MALWKGTINLNVTIKNHLDSKFTHRAELNDLDAELASSGIKIRRIESRISGRNSNAAIRFTPKETGSKSMSFSVFVFIEDYPDSKFLHNIRLVGLENKLASFGWHIGKTSCRNEKWVGDLAIRATVEGVFT